MNMPSQKISGAWQFGLVWMVLNAAGWGVGFGLELLILHNASLGVFSNLLASLVAAGIIGLVQWLALRWLLEPMRSGSQGIAWVILTMFGYTAGFLAAGLVTGLLGDNMSQGNAAVDQFCGLGAGGFFHGQSAVDGNAVLFAGRGLVGGGECAGVCIGRDNYVRDPRRSGHRAGSLCPGRPGGGNGDSGGNFSVAPARIV